MRSGLRRLVCGAGVRGERITAMSEIDWERIRVAFAEPFNPADVDFRVQGKASESTGKAQIVAYVDARTVQDRLDAVVGPGAWTFDYTPLAVDAKGVVLSAKGVLTVHGVSKVDIGDASNFEASKGTVSDALKRAAVQWGIGRYLYAIPSAWVAADKFGKIDPAALQQLRARLPKPGQSATPATHATPATPATRPAPTPAATQATPASAKPATKAATKAAPQENRKQPPAPGSVRLLGKKCGYESQSDYDDMVRRVTGKSRGWTVADQWLVKDYLDNELAAKAEYDAAVAAGEYGPDYNDAAVEATAKSTTIFHSST